MFNRSHLILGGARSGKSRYAKEYAEKMTLESDAELIYLATATADDAEMEDRISKHKQDRSTQWNLVEESIDIGAAIKSNDAENTIILIDCLTLWLSNCLHNDCWLDSRVSFFESLQSAKSQILAVNNETGLGVVPMGELSRRFVDENGFLNQELAHSCSKVTLVVAGLPQLLKDE